MTSNIEFQLDDKTFTLHETSAAAAEAAADRAEAAAETVEGVPAIIAPVFSESASYASGYFVIYSGKLYQFIADHAAGAWTGADAEEMTVSEKLDEGGISSVAQALLINILRNATYTSDQSTNITNLETALSGGGGSSTVAIVNTLTNCTNDNSALSIRVGSSYIATITADEGYDIESASVLMGGQDVTASVYAAGVITIPYVTGTLVITVTAAEQTETGLAHYWKLTTGSIIDTIDGETELTVGANTEVTAGIGATIDAAKDFITIHFPYRTYSKIKIKFGAMTNNGSGNERLIGIKYGASSTPAIALRYNSTSQIWQNASNTYVTAFTAADAFANNELVLERNASNLGKAIDITFGADAVISGYSGGTEYNYVDIGGSSGSGFYTVVVEYIKVYT